MTRAISGARWKASACNSLDGSFFGCLSCSDAWGIGADTGWMKLSNPANEPELREVQFRPVGLIKQLKGTECFLTALFTLKNLFSLFLSLGQ